MWRQRMIFLFDFANYFTMIRLAWNEKVTKARIYYLAVLCLVVPVVDALRGGPRLLPHE